MLIVREKGEANGDWSSLREKRPQWCGCPLPQTKDGIEDGMAVWCEKIWRPRPVSFFNRTSLLIFDSFSAHIDEAVIPGGL